MEKRRCPECGYLTAESKCPICMVRIPGNVPPQRTAEPKQTRTYTPPRQTPTYAQPRQTGTYTPPRQTASRRSANSKKLTAVILLLFLVPFVLVLFIRASVLSGLDEVDSFFDDLDYEVVVEPEEWPVSMETEPVEWGWTGSVPTVEETVVWDQDGITVTASGMEVVYDDPAVWLTVSNNTGRNIALSADAVAVNGFVLERTSFYCNVGKGETVMEPLCLYSDDLNAAGIDTIAEVGFSLYGYDSDLYETVCETDWILLETSDAGYVQTFDFDGTEILNEGGIRVEYLESTVEDDDGDIRFYLENISDVPVAVYGDEMRVNGQSAEDGWLFVILQPGYRTLYEVHLYDVSELDVYTAGDLKEMSITFQVDDMESWDSVLDNREITFTLGENG